MTSPIGNNDPMTTSKMRANVIMKLREEDVRDVEDWRDLDGQIKKLTADRDAIIKRFKTRMEAMGAHVCTFRNAPIVERNETRRQILDQARLKMEKPEIVTEYTKLSETWRPAYVS